jgi:hypothetical protein
MAAAPGSSRTSCGSWSSRCCRRGSGASAIRAASVCPTGGCSRGSCSFCTRGSPGSTCRPSSASAPASPAGDAWTSGSGSGCGRSFTLSCWRACARSASSSGRGRSPTRATCRRKGAPRRARARLSEPETAPNTTSSSTPRESRSPGLSGGNRNDVTQLIPLLDAIPNVRGAVGRPPQAARAADRRPRLRPRQVPTSPSLAWHQARDRPSPDRARLRAR